MPTAPAYKILIVDDDKFLLDMYSIKFSEKGFEVSSATNGEEALERVKAGVKPDIFLVDVLMPKMDGFQLVDALKKQGFDKTAAIIILSNLGQKDDIDRGLSLGVDGYIIKASATPGEVVTKATDIVSAKLKAKS